MIKTCLHCGREFETNRSKRKYCGAICNYERFKNDIVRKWTEQEEEILIDLLGTMPSCDIPKAYLKEASKLGLRLRTEAGVRERANKLVTRDKVTLKCEEDNFSINAITELLGVTRGLIQKFIDQGKLPCRKVNNQISRIKRKDLKRVVRTHPESFSHCDRIKLFWLLEDEKKVDKVKNVLPLYKKRRRGNRVKVTDGQTVYPSIRQAAIALNCHKETLRDALDRNRLVKGKRLYFYG